MGKPVTALSTQIETLLTIRFNILKPLNSFIMAYPRLYWDMMAPITENDGIIRGGCEPVITRNYHTILAKHTWCIDTNKNCCYEIQYIVPPSNGGNDLKLINHQIHLQGVEYASDWKKKYVLEKSR